MSELDAVAQALSNAAIVSAVEFAGVTLAFGARTVLAGIDLAIRDSEFIGVLGPNGSGKTTLMRAILGLLPPRSGTIRVLGRPVARGNPAVGYMPQMRGALDNLRLSGWDFVASGVNGHRWGLPLLGAQCASRSGMGARPGAGDRPRAAPAGRNLRRRAPAPAAGAGAAGTPAAAAAGRAADQPRPAPSARRGRADAHVCNRNSASPCCSAPMSSIRCSARWIACSTSARAMRRWARWTRSITGPVLSRLYGSEIEVVRVNGRIFVMSGGHDVERDAHQHDHGAHHVHV